MKKNLLLIAFTFFCVSLSAQLVTSTSITRAKKESRTIWMLRTGLTTATLTGSDVDSSVKSLAGYNVSMEFNKSFATNFYWGSGLLFGNSGFKISESGYTQKLTTAKLEVPLNFGYKYPVTDQIKIDAHAGGFVNFDLFGKLKDDYDSINIGDLDDYNRLGAGLQFGIGAWYEKFNFNITYQRGLTKKMDDTKAFENNWLFTIGYAF